MSDSEVLINDDKITGAIRYSKGSCPGPGGVRISHIKQPDAQEMSCRTWSSLPITISPGLPQGFPLSPSLFNIYTLKLA
jgi:hypothetical protein